MRAYPASTAAGSTRDLLGLESGLSYTLSAGDGMARLVAVSTIEYELHGNHEAVIEAQVHAATPRFGFGRIVVDGVLADRYENYLNLEYSLGGSGRLRGYPLAGFEGSLRGETVVAGNAEFRTTSADIFSMQVGLDAFYDTGAAADGFDSLAFLHSVGLGLRILFPYFESSRIPGRLGLSALARISDLPGSRVRHLWPGVCDARARNADRDGPEARVKRAFFRRSRIGACYGRARMLGFRLLVWAWVVLALLGLAVPAEASTKNLLAGLAPSRIDAARNPKALTDGVQAPKGHGWNTELSAILTSRTGFIQFDLGSTKPIDSAYLQGDNNDSYVLSSSTDGQSFREISVAGPDDKPGMRQR